MFWKLPAIELCSENTHISSLLCPEQVGQSTWGDCVSLHKRCVPPPLLHPFMIFISCSFTSTRHLLRISHHPTQLMWVLLPWQGCILRHNDNLRQEGTLCCDTALKGEATAVLPPCCSTSHSPAGVSSTLGSVR